MSTKQKPETEARRVAEQLCGCRICIEDGDCSRAIAIAAALTAKDAEIERLKAEVAKQATEAQGVIDYMPEDAKVICGEGLWATLAVSVARLAKFREDFRDQHKAQTELLVEACQKLKPLAEYANEVDQLRHKDDSSCVWRFTARQLRDARQFLSHPEVAAFLAGKAVTNSPGQESSL